MWWWRWLCTCRRWWWRCLWRLFFAHRLRTHVFLWWGPVWTTGVWGSEGECVGRLSPSALSKFNPLTLLCGLLFPLTRFALPCAVRSAAYSSPRGSSGEVQNGGVFCVLISCCDRWGWGLWGCCACANVWVGVGLDMGMKMDMEMEVV